MHSLIVGTTWTSEPDKNGKVGFVKLVSRSKNGEETWLWESFHEKSVDSGHRGMANSQWEAMNACGVYGPFSQDLQPVLAK